MNDTEYFEIVDEHGTVIGRAPRAACHGDPSLVHRTVHVLVFNSEGDLFLQKRSTKKDIQPGKWDTSVGGHLAVGETCEEAVHREMAEELGIQNTELTCLYDYPMRNEIESENVRTYSCVYDGPFQLDPEEIDEGRFWSIEEIERSLGSGVFTPNFEEEFGRYREYMG